MAVDPNRSVARLTTAVGVVALFSLANFVLFVAAGRPFSHVLGFAVVPGIGMGINDMDTAPAWIWIGFIGWLGISFVYPIWCLWLGRVLKVPR